jgi:hypothetical protein
MLPTKKTERPLILNLIEDLKITYLLLNIELDIIRAEISENLI